MQELDGFRLRPLERVSTDDAAESATVPDGPGFLEDVLIFAFCPSRENDDAMPVERALHHMFDPFGQCLDRNLFGFVDFLGRRLLEMGRRKLDLDEVCA